MPSYMKQCPICLDKFLTNRMNANMCSKKCRNRARSFPAKVLQALLEKVGSVIEVRDSMTERDRMFLQERNIKEISNGQQSKAPGLSLVQMSEIEQEAFRIARQRGITHDRISSKNDPTDNSSTSDEKVP